MPEESYLEREPYQEQYACGTQSTGFGATARTTTRYCSRTQYRTVTRYRSKTRSRLVPRQVEVNDGNCAAASAVQAEVGKVYLLQYDYSDHGTCSLTCYQQSPQPGGGFENEPCPPAVAAD